MSKITFQYQRERKQNPYIGFTSFQHFRKDELYSDLIVRPENNMTETEHVECYPVPDYVEEKGRAQGYYPDSSIVYIRILWKEFEPKKGEYNYAFLEDILKKAKENDQTVMFRLMQHSTRESDDVPDWLKEEIDCPKRPVGMRIKDCPTDQKFLDYFGLAIRKIGERFDGDPTLGFIDVSLPGAWGEGCCIDKFTEEQIKDFVDIYTDSFKNTLVIGQVVPWVVHYMNEQAPVGWRADCIGKPELTFERVSSLESQMSDVWKRGHISFEAYWWLGEWKRQGWDLDKIIDVTLSWHISAFNGKSLPIPYEWKDKVDAWVAKMGYHFAIDSVELLNKAKSGEKLVIELGIDNVGVAPIYKKIPLYFKIGERRLETAVDIRDWLPGKTVEKIELSVPKDIEAGEYALAIGIGGEGYPNVAFATDAPERGEEYLLTKITIE